MPRDGSRCAFGQLALKLGRQGLVLAADDVRAWPLRPAGAADGDAEIEGALIYFLRTANKGVAHLTIDSRPTDLRKLLIAARAIRRLVQQHVYAPLGKESLLDRRHHPCAVAEAMGVASGHRGDPNRSS